MQVENNKALIDEAVRISLLPVLVGPEHMLGYSSARRTVYSSTPSPDVSWASCSLSVSRVVAGTAI